MLRRFLIFFILTILIGSIYIYPDIRFILELGKDFKGITLTGTPDEAFYLARLNGVYKGDYRLANIGLYEHRNDLWIVPPYFEVAIGLMGKALNIPVPYLDIILSFLFPVIIFWLFFMLIYYLSRSQRLGILGACSILLGYALFTTDFNIFREIMTFKYSQPLWFLRPFSPQLIYIPFILSLLLIFLFIDTDKKWRLILIALSITSLNYLHLYLWTFLFVGLGIWLIIAMVRRDRPICKNLIIVLILSLLLSLTFWLNLYRVTLSPNYAFLKEMFGAEYSRMPFIPFAYILIGSIILFWNRESEIKNFYFLLTFLLSGLVCLNQQIITGMIIEPFHFSSYTNKTFLIIALIGSLNKIRWPKKLLEKVLYNCKTYIPHIGFVLWIGFLLFTASVQQNNYYQRNKKMYTDLQSLAGAVNWLNHHTKKEDVILTDSIEFPSFIFVRNLLLYTTNYHYLSLECHSLISRLEMENRILSAMRFFEYSSEEAEQVFNYADGLNFFGMSARYGVVKDIDRYILKLKERYRAFMDKSPIDLLGQYKLDYILVGKKDRLFNTIESEYPELVKVFDDSNYKIFRF